MSITIHMHPVSTASRPVTLFVTEKKLPVEMAVVDLMAGAHRSPEFLAINPSSMVPALVEDKFVLTESSAILKYLAAKFDLPEYPKDLQKRAKVDEAMDWFNTQFYREFGYGLVYPQVFPHHKRPTDEHHNGHVAWGKEKTQRWLGVLDNNILGKNDYVANNAISIADYFGVCLITAGEVIGCTFSDYPNVCRWIGNMKKLGAWESVNAVMYGFAGSMKDKQFETV